MKYADHDYNFTTRRWCYGSALRLSIRLPASKRFCTSSNSWPTVFTAYTTPFYFFAINNANKFS